ncbi:MAG: T9SS type A sorting domain-containing protein [Cyclobacteriaceae bacterium]
MTGLLKDRLGLIDIAMKNSGLFFFFLLGSSLTTLKLVGQVNTITAGGNAIGAGAVNFSVGQIFYQYNSGSNGSVNEGNQQPYIVELVTGVEETNMNRGVMVYPNPTTDYLHLKIDSTTTLIRPLFDFQLTDMNGRLIQDETSIEGEVEIFIGNLDRSVYFLRVATQNGEVRIYRIVKR